MRSKECRVVKKGQEGKPKKRGKSNYRSERSQLTETKEKTVT